MARKLTMADIAEKAGVDVSTVSRALNNSPLVKPDTKEQVLAIAEASGYVINASARGLRRQANDTIGLVIPLRPESGQSISDPFFLEMIAAVCDASDKRGYDVIINLPHQENSIAEKRLLSTGKADGVIIVGQAGRDKRLRELGSLSDKVVVWGAQAKDEDYTVVGSDNFGGGYLAGEHLCKLGRRNIVFLGPVNLPEGRARYDGFCAALSNHVGGVQSELVVDVDFNEGAGYQSIKRLLDRGVVFDGIFAASDVLGLAAMRVLQESDVSVPQDVSVVGYDNVAQGLRSVPPLTTVDQNIKQGGDLMVTQLLKKLAGERVDSMLTPTELIVRGSCGGH